MRDLFLTEYTKLTDDEVNGSRFASYILAKSWEEAELIAEERELGEKIVGSGHPKYEEGRLNVMRSPIERYHSLKEMSASPKVWQRTIISLLHQTMLLLDIGEMSGRYLPRQPLFGDTDALHQLIHLLDLSSEPTGLYSVEALLSDLTRATPEMFLTEEELKCLKEQ